MKMKSIILNEYHFSYGKLICLESPMQYNLHHINGSINIPYEELLYNKDKYLNKVDTYYLYCNEGHKSRRATNILEAYGYKVVRVVI